MYTRWMDTKPTVCWYVQPLNVQICAKDSSYNMNSNQMGICFVEIMCEQCWEGYFGNVIGYRLQVTL